MATKLDVVELEGGARARGESHGEQLRQTIHDFYGTWVEFMCSRKATTEADLLSYAASHLPAARAFAPDLVEEVAAIADGAELQLEQIFLLNCFDEVGCHGPGDLVSGLHHCTAFGVTGAATTGGTTLLGQGWDSSEIYPMYVLRLVVDEAPEALVLSHPGVIGGTGINASGLGLVWNTLKSTDGGVGVPAPFVIRKALQARDLATMLGNVVRSRRANGMNFIVGSPEQAVNIELTATRYRISYCYGVLAHANHFEDPAFLDSEADLPLDVPDTLLRGHRMRDLLAAQAGSIDVAVARACARRPRRGAWIDLPSPRGLAHAERRGLRPRRANVLRNRRQSVHAAVRRVQARARRTRPDGICPERL